MVGFGWEILQNGECDLGTNLSKTARIWTDFRMFFQKQVFLDGVHGDTSCMLLWFQRNGGGWDGWLIQGCKSRQNKKSSEDVEVRSKKFEDGRTLKDEL